MCVFLFFFSFAHFWRHRAQSLFLLLLAKCSIRCLLVLFFLYRFRVVAIVAVPRSFFETLFSLSLAPPVYHSVPLCAWMRDNFLLLLLVFLLSFFDMYCLSSAVSLVLSIIYHVIFAVMSCACKLVLSFFSADRCHLFMSCFRRFFPNLCSVPSFARSVACRRAVLIPHVKIIKKSPYARLDAVSNFSFYPFPFLHSFRPIFFQVIQYTLLWS